MQLMMQVMVGVSLQSMQRDVKGSTQLTPSEASVVPGHEPWDMNGTRTWQRSRLHVQCTRQRVQCTRQRLPLLRVAASETPPVTHYPCRSSLAQGNPESVHDLLTSVMSAPEAMTQAGTQLSLIVRQARAEVDAAADDDVDMEGGEGAGSRLSSALARLPAPVIDRIVSLLPTAMLGFSLPSVRLSRQSVALRAERASDPAP